jgi:3-deoxy-D-manno-octulosonic-acid transferase
MIRRILALENILMHIFYDLIFLTFMVMYLPYFVLRRKFHKSLWQRFGFYPREIERTFNRQPSPVGSTIWLHAVSVGEVAAIKAFWERLRREFQSDKIVISTVTKTGNELAKKFAAKEEAVFYLPLDISFIIRRVLRKIKPKALIIAETEVWPNLISICHSQGIPVFIINGRISDRAFKRYKLIGFALASVLKRIGSICVQTTEDKERFVYLGAPSQNVKVAGNMKYCNVQGSDEDCAKIKAELSISADNLIFTAGSTHKGEEEAVLDVFKRLRTNFKNLYLIIAPRHVERAGDIKRLTEGLPVTVIDKIGALQRVYSISDMVFIGGSLIRHGGHNIIEPAIFGKPVIFGPYMFNFKDVAATFLKAGAAVMVRDAQELEFRCRRLLSDKNERVALGEGAKKVVLENQGAVENCIHEIKRVFDKSV